MMRIGIVGCGTIGSSLARALDREHAKIVRVVAVADPLRDRARALQQSLASHPAILSLPQLIRRSQLVIEAASAKVSARVARLALAAHRDVLVMSTGGLLARAASWPRLASRSRGQLFVPSGGLAGLDGVKAMAIGTIRTVRLTTSKPPRALAGAPLVRRRRIVLDKLREPTVIFEGSPAQAVREFPQNTNVAATLMLACLLTGRRAASASSPRIRVRVIADPGLRQNVHELEVEGDCGRISARVQSRPSATNPKTSEIAVRSALAVLRQRFSGVRIGT